MGKGCRYRPVNKKKYDENYDRIFGKTKDKEAHAVEVAEAQIRMQANIEAE